jgi:8-oxo-dGTP pyrophosphatase MutT (NUDIX family)
MSIIFLILDESYDDNAFRELQEEAGVKDEKLIPIKTFYYEDIKSRVWGKVRFIVK